MREHGLNADQGRCCTSLARRYFIRDHQLWVANGLHYGVPREFQAPVQRCGVARRGRKWSYVPPAHTTFSQATFTHASTTMHDMTVKREANDDDSARVKRVKTETDGGANPYLAHWDDTKPAMKSEYGSSDALANFERHATTSKQAMKAEDGPNNPFTGRPLSSKYMSILKTRRDLPVHQQRYVSTSYYNAHT
jgi:hypothetical protein